MGRILTARTHHHNYYPSLLCFLKRRADNKLKLYHKVVAQHDQGKRGHS